MSDGHIISKASDFLGLMEIFNWFFFIMKQFFPDTGSSMLLPQNIGYNCLLRKFALNRRYMFKLFLIN